MDMCEFSLQAIFDAYGIKSAPHRKNTFLCPFCNDSSGHLEMVSGAGIWHCYRCGQGGGILDFISQLANVSRHEARDIAKEISADPSVRATQVAAQQELAALTEMAVPLQSPKELDRSYKMMLRLLPLKQEHKEDLLRRGLSETEIREGMYSSAPPRFDTRVASHMQQTGCALSGVPGLYSRHGEWTLNIPAPGYFVPYRNADGLITGLQIRVDPEYRKQRPTAPKYLTLSSKDKKSGVGAALSVHCANWHGQTTACLTEGALKADVAAALSKHLGCDTAFIAIPGVSLGRKRREEMLALAPKIQKLYDCIDMDKIGNKSVEKNEAVVRADMRLSSFFKEIGISFVQKTWPEQKGIDDFLLVRWQKKQGS